MFRRGLVLVLAFCPSAFAVPLQVAQQGYLVDGLDQPVTQAGANFSFRLVDQSAPVLSETVIWTGTCAIDVHAGYYGATLGTETCAPGLDSDLLPPAQGRWLEITIGGIRMLPRLLVTPAPTAMLAAESLDTQALRARLSTPGTLNAASNPVDWSQLKGVPPGLADGTDDGREFTAGVGLALENGEFSVASAALTNSMLAHSSVTVASGAGLEGGGAVALGSTITLGLAPTGVTAGTYTLPTLVVDASGRISSATNGSLQLPDSGVTAGTYTNATITVDAQGRITSITAGSAAPDLTPLAGLTRPCNAGAGTQTFSGSAWGTCVANAWNCASAPTHSGCVSGSEFTSCKAIRDAPQFNGTGTGTYFIDPDGAGTVHAPRPVTCEMTGDGGGWTLCVTRDDIEDNVAWGANACTNVVGTQVRLELPWEAGATYVSRASTTQFNLATYPAGGTGAVGNGTEITTRTRLGTTESITFTHLYDANNGEYPLFNVGVDATIRPYEICGGGCLGGGLSKLLIYDPVKDVLVGDLGHAYDGVVACKAYSTHNNTRCDPSYAGTVAYRYFKDNNSRATVAYRAWLR